MERLHPLRQINKTAERMAVWANEDDKGHHRIATALGLSVHAILGVLTYKLAKQEAPVGAVISGLLQAPAALANQYQIRSYRRMEQKSASRRHRDEERNRIKANSIALRTPAQA